MKIKERSRGVPSPCSTCGRDYAPLRVGECVSCYRFRKRTGKKRPYGEMDGRPIGVPKWDKHYAWKGDAASEMTKRARIQRILVLGKCRMCPAPATDRHHIDEDPGNNRLDNILPLCRRCHMQIDGRRAKFLETCAGLKYRKAGRSKGEYPANWANISDDVCRNADNRCIRCHHPYTKGAHGRGEWTQCDSMCNHAGPVRVVDGKTEAQWRILTVHHFDGKKDNCEWHNLLALCQRCHLQVQSKVDPEVPWFLEHSDWLKPYVAGFYAHKYEGRNITCEEANRRLNELLSYERKDLSCA